MHVPDPGLIAVYSAVGLAVRDGAGATGLPVVDRVPTPAV
jgi:hypothetical protein